MSALYSNQCNVLNAQEVKQSCKIKPSYCASYVINRSAVNVCIVQEILQNFRLCFTLSFDTM